MGDRVLVTFKNISGLYPCIYSHWGAEGILAQIRDAAPKLRRADASYSTARFCAYLCAVSPDRNTGVGILPSPSEADIAAASHGDGGVVVVDIDTGAITAYGGYLAEAPIEPLDINTIPR